MVFNKMTLKNLGGTPSKHIIPCEYNHSYFGQIKSKVFSNFSLTRLRYVSDHKFLKFSIVMQWWKSDYRFLFSDVKTICTLLI